MCCTLWTSLQPCAAAFADCTLHRLMRFNGETAPMGITPLGRSRPRGSIRVHKPNTISICLVKLPQSIVWPTGTHRPRYICSNRPHLAMRYGLVIIFKGGSVGGIFGASWTIGNIWHEQKLFARWQQWCDRLQPVYVTSYPQRKEIHKCLRQKCVTADCHATNIIPLI